MTMLSIVLFRYKCTSLDTDCLRTFLVYIVVAVILHFHCVTSGEMASLGIMFLFIISKNVFV